VKAIKKYFLKSTIFLQILAEIALFLITTVIAASVAAAPAVHAVAHAHMNGLARGQRLQLAQLPDGFAELVLLRLRHAHCGRDCRHLLCWKTKNTMSTYMCLEV